MVEKVFKKRLERNNCHVSAAWKNKREGTKGGKLDNRRFFIGIQKIKPESKLS
jgi:hypothetical protein